MISASLYEMGNHSAKMQAAAGWLPAAVLLSALGSAAAEPADLLRLKSGQQIVIRQGWEASFVQGYFRFEYVRPRRLACTMPLEDVFEVELPDGTILRNHYEPPRITYSTGAILDVTATIVEHESRYPARERRERVNTRGWNSRTGRYE